MHRTLTPGGWIELMEIHTDMLSDDNTLLDGSPIKRMGELWHPAAEKLGLKIMSGEELEQMCKEAGFVDVKLRKLKQPWGPW